MNFVPLHNHSHYSLTLALPTPEKIVKKCSELGYTACALTDYGTIAGSVKFIKACKKYKIKPLLGCEFYIKCSGYTTTQVIIAKNTQGWNEIIRLISESNDEENFDVLPYITIDMLEKYSNNNLISFTGYYNSVLDIMIKNKLDIDKYISQMKTIFDDGFYITDDYTNIADKYNIFTLATHNTCYIDKEDAIDHRVLLCSGKKTTIREMNKKIADGEHKDISPFFSTDVFSIQSQSYIEEHHADWGIYETEKLSDMCEEYDITGPPRLPTFEWTEGMGEAEYLRHLCRTGWKAKLSLEWDQKAYGDRVKKELEVFHNANLEGYFLIVRDYLKYAKNQGWLICPGRGSVGGSLVAYLIEVTTIDPIKYGLIFERFFNAGRSTKERVSLPDIDCDFPITKREKVIQYIQDRYGHDRVCQMVTFGRLQGRGAIKEVFRINSVLPHEKINKITKGIPDEAKIADKLQESGETSVIRWVLKNHPKVLKEVCVMDDDGNLNGEYVEYIEQAIRLEGVFKSQGKHAAGIIISGDILRTVCPMIQDKNSDEKIAGMDMEDLEAMGHVKFDILGVAILDKLMGVNNLLQYGKVEPNEIDRKTM